PHLRVLGQEAIHHAFGTEILAGVEQRGIDLRRRVIHEAWLMQQGEDRGALARAERPGRGTPRRRGPRGPAPTIVGRARQPARRGVRWGESSPPRRSNAPPAPGVLQPSASRTIFRLYSTVNRRRVAFATTSIAGPSKACSSALIALRSCLALDSKLPGGHCLTHIGREGGANPAERRCRD